MPHHATQHARAIGQTFGDGHCVAAVRELCGLPHTSYWRRGEHVRGAALDAGTAIAVFDADDRYGNHTDGRSHCAILVSQNSDGLLVVDQWVDQPCHTRTIRFREGQGDAVNDGDRYYTIELADDGDG